MLSGTYLVLFFRELPNVTDSAEVWSRTGNAEAQCDPSTSALRSLSPNLFHVLYQQGIVD